MESVTPKMNEPLYVPFGGDGPRRPRLLMILTMLIVMIVVLFGVFKVIPLEPGRVVSQRQAKKLIARAKQLEGESRFLPAAELYDKVYGSEKVRQPLRIEAGSRLAALYRDQLGNAGAADMILTQVAKMEGVPFTATASPKNPGEAEIARIGDQGVTVNEVLYAWSQFHGSEPPDDPERFEPFVHWYLDHVLMADEAQRLGLDRQGHFAMDLKLKRVLALSQALRQQVFERMPDPDAKTIEAFYETHIETFGGTPGRALIGHIVVSNADEADRVAEDFELGATFAELAREYSMDAKELDKGYMIGEIADTDRVIEHIGEVPGLARSLTSYEAGATTGPIRTERGFEWIRVIESTPATRPPLEDVIDEVVLAYHKQRLAQLQNALLAELRKDRQVEILRDPTLGLLNPTDADDRPTTQPQ